MFNRIKDFVYDRIIDYKTKRGLLAITDKGYSLYKYCEKIVTNAFVDSDYNEHYEKIITDFAISHIWTRKEATLALYTSLKPFIYTFKDSQ